MRQILGPVVGMAGILFAGFLITRQNIDPWFIWLYYLSPFSWASRAFAVIEFHSERYDQVNFTPKTFHNGPSYLSPLDPTSGYCIFSLIE
jgi:ABC-type multidrug transport system permease subunit